MNSIREQIVSAMHAAVSDAHPEYDVRRLRRRPVDKADKPSVAINLATESATDETAHDATESTLTVEVVIAASVDCDSEIDPVMADAHRAIMADDTLGGLAEMTSYTGCTWTYEEGGDGLAITAVMTFDVRYLHDLTDMTLQS